MIDSQVKIIRVQVFDDSGRASGYVTRENIIKDEVIVQLGEPASKAMKSDNFPFIGENVEIYFNGC